jgi:hypothetical protein
MTPPMDGPENLTPRRQKSRLAPSSSHKWLRASHPGSFGPNVECPLSLWRQ